MQFVVSTHHSQEELGIYDDRADSSSRETQTEEPVKARFEADADRVCRSCREHWDGLPDKSEQCSNRCPLAALAGIWIHLTALSILLCGCLP